MLQARVNMLAKHVPAMYVDSQDWSAVWANAMKYANDTRDEAHNYLGTVSVLNCILNRPREANMSAATLLQHAGRVKASLQSRRMQVDPGLLTILDDTVARVSAGR